MIDAIILICSFTGDGCTSVVSPGFFSSMEQCHTILEEHVYQLNETYEDVAYIYKCIDWGSTT